jgi:hypothetical protein
MIPAHNRSEALHGDVISNPLAAFVSGFPLLSLRAFRLGTARVRQSAGIAEKS